ncbi:MAG: arginine--tRNA ligase [Vallitaleaceae bacterium]|nr:arginine--tRNA ligase [Vallitaleaceae bacterium]
MKYFKEAITKEINQIYTEIDIIFSVTPDVEMGHLSIPCFTFSRLLRRAPADIALEFSSIINRLDFIATSEVKGGYLNCFIKEEVLFKTILQDVFTKKEKYGSNQSGISKSVLIEHTSINPNASPHVGRARNAMIGDTIVRLLRFEGYNVEVHYFVNDIGKQIAMLLLGSRNMDEITFKDLLNIYIDINNQTKENPKLEDDVFKLLYELENGNIKVKEEFRKLVKICIDGQTDILRELGIVYDVFDYESDYLFNNRLNEVLDEFIATGNIEEDESGRYVLNQEKYNLPMKSPYLVLTRKDKTSLYPLRDIAYTIDKVKKMKDRNIIILGEDQILYHKQIKSALDVLGLEAPIPVHYSFVLLAEGKMATRNGTVVLLEDFMAEALEKSKAEIIKRRGTVDEKTAKAIAYGAVKYSILKTSNDKNVTFDWDSALCFEGDSGPYLQYSFVRINSIQEKLGDIATNNVDYSLLTELEELELILEISKMPDIIESAMNSLSPHIVATYLLGITQRFSKFYNNHSVMNAETHELKIARYSLIMAVKQVISNCFTILGIDSIEQM